MRGSPNQRETNKKPSELNFLLNLIIASSLDAWMTEVGKSHHAVRSHVATDQRRFALQNNGMPIILFFTTTNSCNHNLQERSCESTSRHHQYRDPGRQSSQSNKGLLQWNQSTPGNQTPPKKILSSNWLWGY